MKKTSLKSILAVTVALILGLACMAGCSTDTASNSVLATGGVLCLKVNPEIAISYDDNGLVTSVDARNADAEKILEGYTGYEGKETRDVVTELVNEIGAAGYFVEEIEGENRRITIEIETGSKLPDDKFLDEIVSDVKTCVNTNDWRTPLDVKGESDYGITDYVDTDYGTGNDGVTDYAPSASPENTAAPEKTPAATPRTTPRPGTTDYRDTDYGPGNDGVTDYNDTDYGPGNDGVTDYDDTDYGPGNDGITDYGNTNYGNTNYGNTNYGRTDYDD